MRADHKAQRYLFELLGPKWLADWRAQPFVVIDNGDGCLDGSIDEVSQRLERMPWPNYVVHVIDGHNSRTVWLRWVKDGHAKLVLVDVIGGVPAPVLCGIDMWRNDVADLSEADFSEEEHRVISETTFDRKQWFCRAKSTICPAYRKICENDELNSAYVKSAHDVALLANAYLAKKPGYPVEVSPPLPRNLRRAQKTARKMPWLAPAPSVIFLRPGEAGPVGLHIDHGGTHASPSPHQRRGHWRRLEDGRQVWVRPAWIGPEAWVKDGQQFRVL